MTDLEMALTVMSLVVGGVTAFGVFWLRVERRQAREAEERAKRHAPFYPEGQEAFTFIASRRELETMVDRGR
jgi:hypothetical protein